MFRTSSLVQLVCKPASILAFALCAALAFALPAEAGGKRSGGGHFYGKGGHSRHVGGHKSYRGYRNYIGQRGIPKSGSVNRRAGVRDHGRRHGRDFGYDSRRGQGYKYSRRGHDNRFGSRHGRRNLAPGGSRYGQYGYGGRGNRHGYRYGYDGRRYGYGGPRYGYGGPRVYRLGDWRGDRRVRRYDRYGGPAIRHMRNRGGYGWQQQLQSSSISVAVLSGQGGAGYDESVEMFSSGNTILEQKCEPGEYCVIRLGPEFTAPKVITLNDTGKALDPGYSGEVLEKIK